MDVFQNTEAFKESIAPLGKMLKGAKFEHVKIRPA